MQLLVRAFSLLLCLGWMFTVQAQQVDVRGIVTAENEGGVPGVSVTIKGTTRGTQTNASGEFTLSNVPAQATLVLSSVGYVTQEVAVGGKTLINVVLKSDERGLDEVVVVGYGTQRKVETTGSIVSVKAAEILQTPVANVAQGLQARVAGMQVTQNSAAPGGNISVRIRGTNSINGSSEPLYVIDGIQFSNGGDVNSLSPLSQINPSDIESVEVLKDASATAIYGARAANGVVLITTKRGKAGVSTVTYEGYYGVQETTKRMPVLNARQFAELENDVFKTNVYADPSSLGEGINWQNLIFRQAAMQNHQISIMGGSDKTQLSLSGNYFKQDGILINSDFTRYSMRLNLDHRVSKLLKVGTSIMAVYSVNNRVPSVGGGLDGSASSNLIGAAIAAPPTMQPYREDGTLYPFGDQFNQRYREVANPLGLASILNRNTERRTIANVYADFSLAKGLSYRASLNVNLMSALGDVYRPRSIQSQVELVSGGGSASKNNSNFTGLLHESVLTYSTKIGEDHSLKFTGLFATQTDNNNGNSISASKFPNDATLNEAVQLATERTVSSYRNKSRLDSYMGRINYGYKDKYFLDLTARVDGASKFGNNNKYGFFPAISGGWRIIEEPFLKRVSWLSDLKLRASYGMTGNAGAIDPYQSLALVSSGSNYVFDHVLATGINPSGIPNPDLKWEKSTQLNLGFDLSLLNNRLNVVMDVYHKRTNDLLFVQQLPISSGYSTITGNFASLENKGIELAVNGRILDGPVKWNVSANATINRNKLLSLGGNIQEYVVSNYTVLQVGRSLGLFKTFIFDGIYQTGESVLPGADGRVGGTKVKDLNGDGAITDDDRTITGEANPKFIYGFSTDVRYKNFDLSALFSGVQGNKLYNLIRYTFENPLGGRNLYAGTANRWTPTNPNNEYPGVLQGGRLPISNRFMEDGSFLRCKNITLGYTLPKIKGVGSARLYVSGNNLFTLTNYSGFDPEVNTFGNSNTQIGIDNLVYPTAKSFLGGIQVTF